MRILVVEDNPIIAMMVADAVEQAGHEAVGPFHDGPSAVSAVADAPVDAALVDFDLGSEAPDGASVVKSLQGSSECDCVFVTGNARMAEASATLALGVLEKPVGPEDVRQVLAGIEAYKHGSDPVWPNNFRIMTNSP